MADGVVLSLILPARCEAGSLATLMPKLVESLAQLTERYEILVIDTQAGDDDTRGICRRAGARHIRRQGGDRYGDAVRTGIAEARGTYVLCMDADGSHDPEFIAAMWERRRNADIVIGSRYVAGGRTDNGLLLRAMSQLLCTGFRAVFRVRIRDVSTSFRLYEAHLLRQLRLEANDFDILQEILIKALGAPYHSRVVEIPIAFRRRTAGSSKRDLRSFPVAYLKTFFQLRLSNDLSNRNGTR